MNKFSSIADRGGETILWLLTPITAVGKFIVQLWEATGPIEFFIVLPIAVVMFCLYIIVKLLSFAIGLPVVFYDWIRGEGYTHE